MGMEYSPIARYEKLMVATDGSSYSEGAIREAVEIARVCASELLAVAVVKANDEILATAPQIIEKAEDEARQTLDEIVDRAAAAGVHCDAIVVRGEEPYRAIVETAAAQQVDMIVMGRRGRTGLARLVMGSVTARVIGHTDRKVLVVPRAAQFTCARILVATDGSSFSEAAVAEALSLSKRCNGTVFAVSSAFSAATRHEAEASVAKVKELGDKEGAMVEEIIEVGEPYQVILKTAEAKEADLIVVGSHGRTGLERLLLGSVAERVIGHADCAVLVAK